MKKRFFLTSVIMCIAMAMNAQAPFTYYTPVYTDQYGRPVAPQQQPQQRDNFQTVNAYYINSRGAFQKIRIKVNVVSAQIGGTSVYVRGYYDQTYNMWHSMNSRATAVTQYSSDAAVIKENFDWKCYISNFGYVYF